MRDEYDVYKAIKNPFAGKFKDGYKFIIHHDSPNGGWDEIKEIKPDEWNLEMIKKIEINLDCNTVNK
jgi:hypothetical protein